LLKKSYPCTLESRVNLIGTAGHSKPRWRNRMKHCWPLACHNEPRNGSLRHTTQASARKLIFINNLEQLLRQFNSFQTIQIVSLLFSYIFKFILEAFKVIQWNPDLVDFKGPEKFISYCRCLLLIISYNKKIKIKYFIGTFLFFYH
jgi:hypothetical protein